MPSYITQRTHFQIWHELNETFSTCHIIVRMREYLKCGRKSNELSCESVTIMDHQIFGYIKTCIRKNAAINLAEGSVTCERRPKRGKILCTRSEDGRRDCARVCGLVYGGKMMSAQCLDALSVSSLVAERQSENGKNK